MPTQRYLRYTADMQSSIWDRYKAGDSVWSIARSFDRNSSSIHGYLSRTGGIRPLERKRAERSLSLGEREEISRGLVAGLSLRTIASDLARAPRRSAGKSVETAVQTIIGLPGRIRMPGIVARK